MVAIPKNKLKNCIEFLFEKLKSNRESDQRNATVFLLCLHGLRCGEVIRLKITDMRIRTKSIYVKTLKGGKQRYVPVERKNCWPALHRESHRSRARGAVAAISNRLGNPLDSRNLRRCWERWRPRFACQSYRIHDLRHTCARQVYEQSGHDPFASKQILGHRRIETTFLYLSNGTEMEDLRNWLPTSILKGEQK